MVKYERMTNFSQSDYIHLSFFNSLSFVSSPLTSESDPDSKGLHVSLCLLLSGLDFEELSVSVAAILVGKGTSLHMIF